MEDAVMWSLPFASMIDIVSIHNKFANLGNAFRKWRYISVTDYFQIYRIYSIEGRARLRVAGKYKGFIKGRAHLRAASKNVFWEKFYI